MAICFEAPAEGTSISEKRDLPIRRYLQALQNDVYTLTPIDESLNRAFLLAHFIIGNKQTAIRVVSQAMAKLEVTATAQGKRLYYKAVGRSPGSAPFRNKVTFSELHLLQRLVYIESEPYEKHKEQASGVGAAVKEDMIVHFIKHLVRITSKRNSFYVTLGISRLLYTYTTPETMAIYNLVVQDPERVKDDYYYRSRKGVLLREIKARFGELVRICQGQRGEERFQSDPNPGEFVDLVRECLSFFTPWMTVCSVPPNVDPIAVGIRPLSSRVDISEHEIELNRMHAVLHPDCYQRLTEALALETPEGRLEVPQFYFSNESKNGGETVRTPNVGLGEEDLTAIKSDLNDLAERRKKASAGFLQVLVDGTEYARIDLKKTSHVRFNVDSWKELLEIWTSDKNGALLLASHLLTFEKNDQSEPMKSSIVLEGGQKLELLLLGDASGLMVDINYQETNPIKAISLVFQRVMAAAALNRLLDGAGLFEGHRSKVLIPVFAFIFLVTITAGVVTYMQRGRNFFESRPVANVDEAELTKQAAASSNDSPKPNTEESTLAQQSGQSSGLPQAPASQSSRSLNTEKGLSPNANIPSHPSSIDPGSETEEEATRSITRAESRLSLGDVKSVFVEFVGNQRSSKTLRDVLVEKLQTSDRLTLSKGRDDADAVLKVTMMRPAAGTSNAAQPAPAVFAIQLINAQGQVIWPLKGRSLKRTYSAPTVQQVGVQILQDLHSDIKQNKKRK
jgi:hypothetical protein